jgi:hypothetical protein
MQTPFAGGVSLGMEVNYSTNVLFCGEVNRPSTQPGIIPVSVVASPYEIQSLGDPQ